MLGQAGREVPIGPACGRRDQGRAALREGADQLRDGGDGGEAARRVRGDVVARRRGRRLRPVTVRHRR